MKNLIKHKPKEGLIQNLQEEMDRIMEDTFGSFGLFNLPKENKLWRPPLEMSETANEYKIKLQLPGFDKKDINVEVGADYISVKAQHSFEKEDKKRNLHRSEFRYGNFMRTVSFPENINPAKASVEFKNGVLSIVAQKINAKEIMQKEPKTLVKKSAKAIAEKSPKAAIKKAPKTLAKKTTVPKAAVKKAVAKKTPLKKMAK